MTIWHNKDEVPTNFDDGVLMAYNDGSYFVWYSNPSDSFSNTDSIVKWCYINEFETIVNEYDDIQITYLGKPIDYTIACETVNKLLDEKKLLINALKQCYQQSLCEQDAPIYDKNYFETIVLSIKEIAKSALGY